MKKILISLLLLIASNMLAGGVAHARQTVVFGMDRFRQTFTLPPYVCVSPGQQLRVVADVLDERGMRMYMPATNFVWRMTLSSGRWFQWDARQTAAFGPFARGPEMDSVYVAILSDTGSATRLETIGIGEWPTAVTLVDPVASPWVRCEWVNADVYVGGNPPPIVPPVVTPTPAPSPSPAPTYSPVPPGNGFVSCRDLNCEVGTRCVDSCPKDGACDLVISEGKYWLVVKSCSENH